MAIVKRLQNQKILVKFNDPLLCSSVIVAALHLQAIVALSTYNWRPSMKSLFRAVATLLAAFSLSLPAAAADVPPTPTKVAGFEIITVDQANGLVGKAQFFDMRSAVNYGKGHIKGAKAMPYDGKSENAENFDPALDKFDVAKLPADKNAPIVFYSDGPTGWKSFKAATQAAKAGYKQVKWMRDGTSGWVAKKLPLD
jgi:rhodanese-related sulfurtransferase